MHVISKYVRPARIFTEEIDTKYLYTQNEPQSVAGPLGEGFPIIFRVAIQVRISRFLGLFKMWTTIWERECDVTDGDTRSVIIKQANTLINTLYSD